MIRYALLVRGINVGGKNKVVMAQLRQELTELGLENVEPTSIVAIFSLILVCLELSWLRVYRISLKNIIHLSEYFSLLSQEDYEEELRTLPDWWNHEMARKDVLFYTESLDVDQVIEKVNSLELVD